MPLCGMYVLVKSGPWEMLSQCVSISDGIQHGVQQMVPGYVTSDTKEKVLDTTGEWETTGLSQKKEQSYKK